MKSLITFITITACLISCSKEENGEVVLSNDYLPLEVGNYWQLDHSEKKEVTETKTINNKVYYAMQYLGSTSYYRIENANVYVISPTNDESLMFNLSAEVNETWNYNMYTVKLVSKTDTITINDSKIVNCYHFYFDVPDWYDEEHSIWLAPEIGFIQEKCGECLYPTRKLDKASIGGQEIDF